MCGIAAIHGSADPEPGRRMLDRIAHRGPDGRGELGVPDAWLGHARLSIVDLEGGDQPLSTADGRLHLVGNGEIYNHKRLRERLGPDRFTTDSDNEGALQLVAQKGPAGLRELWGMYAVAAAGEDGTFVAARDPVGIKPLYWARRDDEVRFASELVAFDEDWRDAVELFPPGHYWTPDEDLVRFARAVPAHVEPRFAPASRADESPPAELVEQLRDTLVRAVERRMMADVRIGVFLSGGLDSSIIAAIAARTARRCGYVLPTFAVGTDDSPDLAAARLVAESLGTEHHERVYSEEEAREVLPAVVRSIESFDPSLVRSAVPNYLLSELTARTVKVVLTGEGADELFAGYEYVRDFGTDEDLHDELVRTVESLHGLNLQRCDRVTMAHGLEARVPFLDLDMIALSLAIPAGWKTSDGDRQEKLILREAFAGWLPDEILWRDKAQFGDGSGAADVLAVEGSEEEAYREIFLEHLRGIDPARTLTRFATA
ncbi:MAG: asparagine synthase (glutamine-hydrolyzing) [Actinomycetota bacterium]|nr:asparagine synthase (glutamine-hydrolyzing) [Actinomycetota bacterium]